MNPPPVNLGASARWDMIGGPPDWVNALSLSLEEKVWVFFIYKRIYTVSKQSHTITIDDLVQVCCITKILLKNDPKMESMTNIKLKEYITLTEYITS